jgi:hypothetical protein
MPWLRLVGLRLVCFVCLSLMVGLFSVEVDVERWTPLGDCQVGRSATRVRNRVTLAIIASKSRLKQVVAQCRQSLQSRNMRRSTPILTNIPAWRESPSLFVHYENLSTDRYKSYDFLKALEVPRSMFSFFLIWFGSFSFFLGLVWKSIRKYRPHTGAAWPCATLQPQRSPQRHA